MRKKSNIRWIPMTQGIYFSITALWPLVHIDSFMQVTGYKIDTWLVKTVSVLLLPMIIIMFSAALRSRPVPLSHSAAVITGTAGLALVELIYYFNGTIRQVYFADALLQMIFLAWWVTVFTYTLGKRNVARQNQF